MPAANYGSSKNILKQILFGEDQTGTSFSNVVDGLPLMRFKGSLPGGTLVAGIASCLRIRVANPRLASRMWLFAQFFAARSTELRHHKLFCGDSSVNASLPGAFHSLYNIIIR